MGEKYKVVSEKILSELQKFEGFYSKDYYLEIEDRLTKMEEKIDEALKEGRVLKIGIVGEVKAGKSSFLNALVFDGKDILPKASTPMTAALTKIRYAKEPKAKIVFYSSKDWERVKRFSQEYDDKFEELYKEYYEQYMKTQNPADYGTPLWHPALTREEVQKEGMFNEKIGIRLLSCKELTRMAENTHINIQEHLGTEMTLDAEALKNGLHNFVGASGDYTSIVKHVELEMNNSMLEGIEIVDTPGLNDPIISRGETTKQFLGECDVVFLLSYSGQFLTQQDISFMCKTLPKEGIRHAILVGSKFDSGVLDNHKAKDVRTACNMSVLSYNKQAEANINACIKNGYNVDVVMRLKNSLPPNYVSSLLYSCAIKKKQGKSYSEQEAKIINNLKLKYKDFCDDEKTLLSLSGIPKIRKEKIIQIKKDKQQIIEEKNREIISDNKKILLEILNNIQIQALKNQEDLKKYDKDKLEHKLTSLQKELNKMRKTVSNTFLISETEAKKFLNEIQVMVEAEIDNYIDFDVNTTEEQCQGTRWTGFLGLKKEYYTEFITKHTASISDVIGNMRKYITRCKTYINNEFEKIINIRMLEENLKKAVIGAFDLSGDDFNEDDILIPVEIVMKKIQIPKINIEVLQFESMLGDSFDEAFVEGEEIHRLKKQANYVFCEIAKAIKEELKQCEIKMESVMTEQATMFVDRIIEQLSENIGRLKAQIDDKEENIKKYDILEQTVVEYKKAISEMEM